MKKLNTSKLQDSSMELVNSHYCDCFIQLLIYWFPQNTVCSDIIRSLDIVL